MIVCTVYMYSDAGTTSGEGSLKGNELYRCNEIHGHKCIIVVELVLCAGAVQPALQSTTSSDSQAHGES